jgi:hypothetical protein
MNKTMLQNKNTSFFSKSFAPYPLNTLFTAFGCLKPAGFQPLPAQSA